MSMSPSKPYLLQSLYQWIVDNDMTPYILVDVNLDANVKVPMNHVKDGEIVLNISSSACRDLSIKPQGVQFDASFSGVIESIDIPMVCIMAIYSFENGKGMVFDDHDEDSAQEGHGSSMTENFFPGFSGHEVTTQSQQENKKSRKSRLTIVK